METSYINQSLSWALTVEADLEIIRLVMLGIDYDLAFAMTEAAWPEEKFYLIYESQAGSEIILEEEKSEQSSQQLRSNYERSSRSSKETK